MLKILALTLSLSAPLSAATGTISTVAGASTLDGVAATSTLVNYPGGVAADGVGNVYISDTGNHRIRRVDAGTGIITTIAGTGVAGYTFDPGPATQAQFNAPAGLSYVNDGNNSLLYVADAGNHRIRRINLSTGMVETVAGTGVATFGGDEDLAINASLNNPRGVLAEASGNFYIVDSSNNRIRYVSANSITTLAGSGIAGFSGDGFQALSANVQLNAPEACVIGPLGNLYIADTNNLRIRMIDLSTKVISTVAGNGSYGYNGAGAATSRSLTYIRGIAADPNFVFFSDSLNNRIRYISGSTVVDFIGTGAAGYGGDGGPYNAAILNNPQTLTVDANYNIVFVDYSNNCVRNYKNTHPYPVNAVAGSGVQDGVPGINVVLKDPARVIGGAGSQILIAEQGANKVRSLDLDSGVIGTFAGTGASAYAGDGGLATAANFFGVKALVRDPAAGMVYVADNYSTLGITYTNICIPFFGCINFPTGTYTYGESRIRRIDSFGSITTVAGGPQLNNTGNPGQAGLARLGLVNGLALSGSANTTLFLSDSMFHVIRRINLNTGVISLMGGLSGTAGYAGDNNLAVSSGAVRFNNPQGMATDSAGNLYIADSGNHVVRKVFAGSMNLTKVAGLGPTQPGYSGDGGPARLAGLFKPTDVFVDAADNIYIADSGNHRIRRIDAISNSITTVVGNGFRGFSGDGGASLSATLDLPSGGYVDASGTIFVADSGNDRVRKVSFALIPTPTPLVSGSGKVAAFPSPADDRICFSYTAPSSGKVTIDVYNTAMQLVARIEDSVASGTALSCGSVKGLANGVYLYRLTGAGGSFAPNKFKVAH